MAGTWYIAEIAILFDFGATSAPLLQNNFVLIRASTPDDALDAAHRRGHLYADKYVNTDGNPVICEFVGIRNLHEVYDNLDDGAELLYEEFTLHTTDEAVSYIRLKSELAVFREGRP